MALAGVKPFKKENENYFRYSSLLVDVGSDILRGVFSSYYSTTTLHTFLNSQKNSNVLGSLIHQGVINSQQKDLISPKSGFPDLKKFDISLLCLLIRNLSPTVNANKLVWTKPSVTDLSLEADVARVRQARNDLHGHMTSTELSDKDYLAFTATLKSIFLRIVQKLGTTTSIWQKRIDGALNEPIDPEGRDDLQRRLNAWYAFDMPRELQEIKAEATATRKETEHIAIDSSEILKLVQRLSDTTRGVNKEYLKKRIRETNLLLDQHESVNARYGIRLKSMDRAIDILEKEKMLVLTGGPGSGKSFMARTIMIELSRSGQYTKPLRINSASEWMKLVDIDEDLVVLIDDFLGKYGVAEHELNEWRACSDLILSCLQNGKVKLIATIRNRLFKQIAPLAYTKRSGFSTDPLQSILSSKITLDISSGSYKLTTTEKEAMVYRYIETDAIKIEKSELSDICRMEGLFGFPQCCRMLKSCSEKSDTLQIFKEPSEFLLKELEHLFQYEKLQYAVLAMTMLLGGVLDVDEILRERGIPSLVLETVGLSTGQLVSVSSAADQLCDVFLKRQLKKPTYSFTHDTIHAAVFKSFGHKHYVKTLQLCSLDILSKVCHAERNTEEGKEYDTWGIFEVSEDKFSLIEDRFNEAFFSRKPDSFQQVSEASIWKDENFVDKFFQRKGLLRTLKLQDVNGDTFLVHAAASGNTTVVGYILRFAERCAGELIEEVEKALKVACKNQEIDTLQLLLDKIKKLPHDIMFLAAKTGNVNIMRMLLGNQCQLECTRSVDDDEELVFAKYTGRKECVLHVACFHGKEEMVKFILEECRLVPEVTEGLCLTPLHLAAASGNVNVLQYLIEQGYNPMSLDDFGANILQFACIYGKEDMAKYIAQAYPKMVELKPGVYRNSSALHSTAAGGNVNIFRNLLERGADPFLLRSNKDSVLSIACNYAKSDMIKYLVDTYPGLINLVDDEGWAPIHFAVLQVNADIVQYLLRLGADPDKTTFDGRTILHIACHSKRVEISDLVSNLFPGMINKRDNFGWCPIHCAVFSGSVKILNILTDCGADFEVKTKLGRTVKDIAREQNHDDVLAFLEAR